MTRDFTKEFNELPKEVRIICAFEEAQMRINQIKIDMKKANEGHALTIRNMKDQIKNLEQYIRGSGGMVK